MGDQLDRLRLLVETAIEYMKRARTADNLLDGQKESMNDWIADAEDLIETCKREHPDFDD